jgi:RNA 3'-terminal phosphate cyclase (ATP)/RNA 3'-terminal phosphate cyclase (GTP)
MCYAHVGDVQVGSTELTFEPGAVKGGNYTFDVGTAGSITLVLQGILLPLLFAPRKVTLTLVGGTCGKWQAPVEYFQNVLLPFVQRFASVMCKIEKRGYYPKGGGRVVVEITPRFSDYREMNVKGFHLVAQGKLMQIKGVSHSSIAGVAERQAQAAQMELQNYRVPTEVTAQYQETLSPGSGITLWARFNDKEDEFHTVIGSDLIGEPGVRAEDVGVKAAKILRDVLDIGAAVDVHAGDQLLPFMALAAPSEVVTSVSEHARTNMWVIEKFLPVVFEADGNVVRVRKM